MPHIIALEGVGGAGKSSLAAPLASLLSAQIIKRPLTSPPPLRPDAMRWWMAADADDCAALAAASTAPYVILDRHYLSAAIYQDPDHYAAALRLYRAAWGEPDVWVICSASASEIIHRLAARPSDGRNHLDKPDALHVIAGRIALYDDAPRHLRAPIIQVRHLPPSSPVSYARWEVVGTRTPSAHLPSPLPPEDLARVVAAHIRTTIGDRGRVDIE